MNKDNIIYLTKITYKITLLFPKKEPLRYKIREIVDNVLANWIKCYSFNYLQNQNNNLDNHNFNKVDSITDEALLKEIVKEINVLDSFFEIIKSQQWVSEDNILAIQREYANLSKSIITDLAELEKRKKNNHLKQKHSFSKKRNFFEERYEKIIDFLRRNKKAQVWQVKEIMPEVTKRTLRRDFDALLKKGLIERIGEKSNTFYQLKKQN